MAISSSLLLRSFGSCFDDKLGPGTGYYSFQSFALFVINKEYFLALLIVFNVENFSCLKHKHLEQKKNKSKIKY